MQKCTENFQCPHCKKSFANNSNLGNHIRSAKYCLAIRGDNKITYSCEFCKKGYVQRASLNRHLKSCASRDENGETIKQLKLKLATKDERIEILERNLTHKDGIIEGIEKGAKLAKTVNKFTNKNSITYKLSRLPTENMQPLTIPYVKTCLEMYTFSAYKMDKDGVVEFIKYLITGEVPSYVCSNLNDKKFHIFVGNKKWESDFNAAFLRKVLDELALLAKIYDQQMTQDLRNSDYSDLEWKTKVMDDLRPFYFGLVGGRGNTKYREKLIGAIAKEISYLTHIDIFANLELEDSIGYIEDVKDVERFEDVESVDEISI